jgi:hypothetical protein
MVFSAINRIEYQKQIKIFLGSRARAALGADNHAAFYVLIV